MSPERRAVVAGYFLVFFGAGVWIPYFPLYLAHLGYPGWQIGVVVGVQPVLRWGSALLWAFVADRWRIRHRVLVGGAFIGALFFVPLLFVRAFVPMLIVLGAIGLFHGGVIPMLDATVMDHLPLLGGDYGRVRLWGSVAFVLGSLVSAPLVSAWSPAIVPILIAVPTFGLAPALARIPSEQLGHADRFYAPWALVTPPMAAFLSTVFLIQMSSGAWTGFFGMHTASLGFSDAIPGVTWSLAVSAEVMVLFWGRRLLEWLEPQDLIVIALLVTVVRWALTAMARDETLVVAIQLGHAVTFSTFHIAALLLLTRIVPAEGSTGGQALYGMVGFGVAATMGQLLAGSIVDRIGTARLFGVEAVLAFLGIVPAWRLRRLAAELRTSRVTPTAVPGGDACIMQAEESPKSR